MPWNPPIVYLGCLCFLMIGRSSSLILLTVFYRGGWGITSLLWRVSFYRQAHFAGSGGFHKWGFLSRLAQNSGYSTSSAGGGGELGHSSLPGGPASSLLYQGQVLGPIPGGFIPTLYKGRQERVRAWAWNDLLVIYGIHSWLQEGLSLTTVTCGSAFAPGRREVILSGS